MEYKIKDPNPRIIPFNRLYQSFPMSSIPLNDFPESLKDNKQIFPFFLRSLELENVNAVVSFYCKIYVLEHILNNKLHSGSPEIETFTIKLLDATESMKNSEDESLIKILNDKTLSLSVVLTFSYKLYNSCLEEIGNYDGSNKTQLAKKMRAALNFLAVLNLFCGENESEVDVSKLGSITDLKQLRDSNKEKSKVLKMQLSRLLKDEVPIKESDADLEKELEDELQQMATAPDSGVSTDDKPANTASDHRIASSVDTDAPGGGQDATKGESAALFPSTPEDKPGIEDADAHDVSLPGAPNVPPDLSDDEVKLPGAPKFLPDDDLSAINKNSSIKVFTAGKSTPERQTDETIRPSHQVSAKPTLMHNHTQHVTRDNLDSIINKTDTINKIQKHAKFAISALNYEDLNTAKKELLEALQSLSTIENSNLD